MNRILSASLLLSAAAFSSAGTLNLNSFGYGENVSITTNFGGNVSNSSVFAGSLNATYNGIVNFPAYCVDLTRLAYVPSSFAVVERAPGVLANAARVAGIYTSLSNAVASGAQGAGLQLAIWDVLYDNGDGLNSGLFRASGFSNSALGYYNAALTATGTPTLASVYDASASNVQSFIGRATEEHSPNAVPEPATMAVLGLGALGLVRRKRTSR